MAEPRVPIQIRPISTTTRPNRVCYCTGCQQYFASPTTFDRHLVGVGTGDVRCLPPEQMRQLGMEPNENGVWQIKNRQGRKRDLAIGEEVA